MSRAAKRSADLVQVHALREILSRRAEASAATAMTALRGAQAGRDDQAARLDDHLTDWNALLAGPFDPARSLACAAAVQSQADVLRQREDAVSDKDRLLDEARTAFRRADAERACARTLMNQAKARAARAREERRLAATDDDNARRASGS